MGFECFPFWINTLDFLPAGNIGVSGEFFEKVLFKDTFCDEVPFSEKVREKGPGEEVRSVKVPSVPCDNAFFEVVPCGKFSCSSSETMDKARAILSRECKTTCARLQSPFELSPSSSSSPENEVSLGSFAPDEVSGCTTDTGFL